MYLAAAGVAGVAVEAMIRAPSNTPPVAYVLSLLAGAPLAFRTRAPLAALVTAEAAGAACAAILSASWSVTVIVVLQLYTVALLGSRLRSLVIGGVTAMAVTIAILLIDRRLDPTGVVTRLPLIFLVLAVGNVVQSRRQLKAAAEERAERESHEREAELQRRTTAERLRIARELHDTLGHVLVAINVRAGVAVELHNAADAETALGDIKRVSAEALRQLRATLGLLREHNDDTPTAPALDLTALPSLVEPARAAGLNVSLDVEVDDVRLSSAVSAAAVRIVQEALTNVLRHAEASGVQVSIRQRVGTLDVEITDDGKAAANHGDSGFGVRGMTERAAALGGRAEAGPLDDGGWRVHAELPLIGDAKT